MPAISNVFIAISSIAGFLLCGVIGMLIGILSGRIYVKNALEGKIGAVIGAFIGCTVIQLVARAPEKKGIVSDRCQINRQRN